MLDHCHPSPAIMELDGHASNMNPLGNAAKEAVAFVVGHVRSHANLLKVQMSRGNYLSSYLVSISLVHNISTSLKNIPETYDTVICL